jgi:hypothetical protein
MDNTFGGNNAACGRSALKFNLSGWDNTAMGFQSLYKNTSGQANTAIGVGSLWGNTTACHNTAIGYGALSEQSFNNGNTIWNSDNVAIGYESLNSNQPTSASNGIKNTALGNYALRANTTGSANTAVGFNTLYDNTTGVNNVATGVESLTDNTTGSYNTADGYRALYMNTTGYSNTACGMNALAFNTTGYENSAVGRATLYSNTTGSHNIAMGYKALYTQSFSNSGTPYESANIAIGCEALYFNQPTAVSNGTDNTAIGKQALYHNTVGEANIAVGNYALYANQSTNNENGRRNTAVGYNALYENTTGYENTALGYEAFRDDADHHNSTALGAWSNITASNQVRIGDQYVTSIGGQVGWTTLSDARFKRNINEDVPGLEFIMKLRPVTYNMDLDALDEYIGTPDGRSSAKDGSIQNRILYTGFIAQEVEEAANSLRFNFSGVDAPKNENDYYGLRYAEFTVPLVKAVQEQQAVLVDQGLRLFALESAVDSWQLAVDFESRIRQLEEENIRLRSDNAAISSGLAQLQQEVSELKAMVGKIGD